MRQVMGDSSPEADKLMRSQGVRALPSFHFWKGGKQIDSISGAKTQALQDAIVGRLRLPPLEEELVHDVGEERKAFSRPFGAKPAAYVDTSSIR